MSPIADVPHNIPHTRKYYFILGFPAHVVRLFGTAWDIAETVPTHLQEIAIAMREFLMENRERRSLERRSSSPRNGRAEATNSDRSAKSSPLGRKADLRSSDEKGVFRIYRRNAASFLYLTTKPIRERLQPSSILLTWRYALGIETE